MVRGVQSDNALEHLRTDLLSIGKPCAMLTILVPTVEAVLNDHTYNKKSDCFVSTSITPPTDSSRSCPTPSEMHDLCEKVVTDVFA